ncbi:glycosyltransferase [Rhodospira trueperi]|uniref:Glycosyltransferase involved in cell wall bisynthesis n=1 Tax=Rhodospira trueperi TaxID=69960 RepID=A0A1G7GQB0_9PROT|nr:glycosyltransferase [Rhodospira trueperi]SDE90358.1 Glycosyltransferase involved in cell wall bisynthesis [Rhodospira trueperi]
MTAALLVAGGFEAGSSLAHAINTVKMAEGFARLGHRVVIGCVSPPDGRCEEAALNEVYGISSPVTWLQTSARFRGRPVGHRWAFALPTLAGGLRRGARMVFARNYVLPYLSARLGLPTMVESHAHPDNEDPDFLALLGATNRPALRGLVTISPVLAESYVGKGALAGKIIVEPDAVDERLFRRPPRLPADPLACWPRPRVVYTGHLYPYKGTDAMLAAAARLPHVGFHLVGGLPSDRERLAAQIAKMGLQNVVLHGQVPHRAVPAYLWHADVLLLPPSAHHPSAAWTSPVKLGEYMMAETPVVASDIPALRHWLDDEMVRFAAPDDGADLARAISSVLDAPARANSPTVAALARAEDWTYRRRAERILRHCNLPIPSPP